MRVCARRLLGGVLGMLVVALVATPSASAFVYWADFRADSIGRVHLDGLGVQPNFITGADEPFGVAVNDTHVFWANRHGASIGRANLDGTGVDQTFITGPAYKVEVDDEYIYWSDQGQKIGRADLDGTNVDPDFITVPSGSVGELAVDGSHIYWTKLSLGGRIGRANLDGTGVEPNFIQLPGDKLPVGLAVTGEHVYWTEIVTRNVGRANLDGTDVDESFIDTSDAQAGDGLAVDGGFIYWTVNNTAIARANLDGTGIVPNLASGFIAVALAASSTGDSPLTLSPRELEFADRADNRKSPYQVVKATNTSPTDLTINDVSIVGSGASSFRAPSIYDECEGTTLAPGETCRLNARFRPDGPGPHTAQLLFADDQPGGPRVLPLSGTGLPGPWLSGTQGLKFGSWLVGTTSPIETATLTNTGSAPMVVTAVDLGGPNAGNFVSLSEDCTTQPELGPSESCTVDAAFQPSATGARSATVTVSHTAPRPPKKISLSGTGR